MWLNALSMFQSSEMTESKSANDPMAPRVWMVARLVKVVSAPAMAAPAPMPSWELTYACTPSWMRASPLKRSMTL